MTGIACWCGQPDNRERVHRAQECVPWVSREGRVPSPDEQVEELASVLFTNDTSDLTDPGWDDYAYEAYTSQARAALDWMEKR